MQIIRNEKRIARLRTVSQVTSLVGMLALIAGMLLIFFGQIEDVFWYQLLALFVGWLLSQVGIYLAHRYVRAPRPDEVLDEAFGGVAKNGRMYHYLLPAPHVLLLPSGIIVVVAKYQMGQISVQGDAWQQKGLGMRRLFGQEQLGNPTKEVETSVQAIAAFLHKHAPQVEEVPIAPMIVFTSKGAKELDLKGSAIPALHFTKVKGFLKQQKQLPPMATADYVAIREAFDKQAGAWAEVDAAV